MYHSVIEATRPQLEKVPPVREVKECPNCHNTRNVRTLGKSFYCTICLLEFDHRKVYAISDFKKSPEKKEKPRYEQRYRTGKRINKDWVVSMAERVIARFQELSRRMTPLEAAGKISEEIDRDPDDILYLIIDLAGTNWEIVMQEKPKSKKGQITR